MKKLFLLPLVAALAILLTACESEESVNVEQDRIYTTYELFYDKNTDKTYAKATFRFGSKVGTLLQLSSPSEVRFNNDVLMFDPTFSYYVKEYAGLVTSGTFTFTDTKGKRYTNTTPLMPTIAFPEMSPISAASSYTLNWVGSPLAANQGVGLLVDGAAHNNVEAFVQQNQGATNLILSTNQLRNLGVGQAILYMDRFTVAVPAEKTSAGGEVIAKYLAENKTVQINN